MKLFQYLPVSVILTLAPSAWATSIDFNFDNPTGILGTSQNYTSGGVTITAYGYNGNGTTTDLYGKQDGGDENGLGLKDYSDYEISTNSFVQLDLTNLWAVNPGSLDMSIGSVQWGESWKIFGSDVLGTLGTDIQNGTTDAPLDFTLTGKAEHYTYLGVEAGSGNVLLSTLSVDPTQAPEPSSILLLGTGLLGIGAFGRKLHACRYGSK